MWRFCGLYNQRRVHFAWYLSYSTYIKSSYIEIVTTAKSYMKVWGHISCSVFEAGCCSSQSSPTREAGNPVVDQTMRLGASVIPIWYKKSVRSLESPWSSVNDGSLEALVLVSVKEPAAAAAASVAAAEAGKINSVATEKAKWTKGKILFFLLWPFLSGLPPEGCCWHLGIVFPSQNKMIRTVLQ